jgi:signal transduction histidine kinase
MPLFRRLCYHRNMKNSSIEPGLLPVFRLFTALEFVFLVFSVAAFTRYEAPKHPASALALMLPVTALLLVYLSWPGLERRLGAVYLPLALSLNVAGVFIGKWMAGMVGPTQYLALSQEMVLFLSLLLLVISWQYNFQTVVLFLAVVGLLDFVLAFLVLGYTGMTAVTYGQTVFADMVAFLVVGYFISHVMKVQRVQRQSLRQANAELSHYAATLEQLTVSQERNRMARELHDTLAHTLSGMAVQLEAVQSLWDSSPDEARTMLGKSLAATRSGLTETRRALQALRASPLDDLGLALALRDLAETAATRAGLRLEWNLPETLPKLSSDIEQGFYRVAQEAFQNITRHAVARQVRVDWLQQNGTVSLAISDDGCGFSPTRVDGGQHFGLRGMQERANMLGADLEVISQPGQGTTIKLSLKG